MELSNEQLIAEAIEINHAGVNELTLQRCEDHLVHFAQYLASAQNVDFYGCRAKHARLFMATPTGFSSWPRSGVGPSFLAPILMQSARSAPSR